MLVSEHVDIRSESVEDYRKRLVTSQNVEENVSLEHHRLGSMYVERSFLRPTPKSSIKFNDFRIETY